MSAFSGFDFFFFTEIFIYLFICLCHVSVVACRIFFGFGTWDLLLLLLSHFSRVRPHRRQPTRLPRPWESPGKNTGVGCHFLLQCMKVKSESEVAQSCLTLSDPMDCSFPGSSVHGIFQARVLEWGAITFSDMGSTSLIESEFPILEARSPNRWMTREVLL